MGKLWEAVQDLDAGLKPGGLTPEATVAPLVATVHLDPKARLSSLLDTWAGMDEAAWAEANVKALYDDLMDIFRDHREADGWYREWRAKNPGARW